MKIAIAKKELAGLLPAGDHVVTIKSATIEHSKENDIWADRTRQLKIVMRNEDGMTTAWLNLDGFKNKSDFANGIAPKGFEFRSYDNNSESFCVNKSDDKRVISEERSLKLAEQVGNLAFCANFTDAEGDIELEEVMAGLLDVEIGVRIKDNSRGKTEVFHFVPSEEVEVIEEIA